jgi:hypothetical protein
MCIPYKTFSAITQGINSKIFITFQLNKRTDFILQHKAIDSVIQFPNSLIQFNMLNVRNLFLQTESIHWVNQSYFSLFDILVSQTDLFSIEKSAFKYFSQEMYSSLRLGFKPSNLNGIYQQSPMLFDEFQSRDNSEVFYYFSEGTIF